MKILSELILLKTGFGAGLGLRDCGNEI
jgi:hypothetical protein